MGFSVDGLFFGGRRDGFGVSEREREGGGIGCCCC